MTQLVLPFRPQPGELEDITQIIADFEAIQALINGGLGNDNMSPAAPLAVDKIDGGSPGETLVTGPDGTPAWQPAGGEASGVIKAFGGDVAPAGYLMCDGAAVSRTTYATLFGVIQTKYGGGDGTNTFNLPNLKGRIPVGRDAAQGEFDVVGEAGGAKTHLLTAGESGLRGHAHGVNDPSHGHFINRGDPGQAGVNAAYPRNHEAGAPTMAAATSEFTGISIQAAGPNDAASAHNNLQPYLTVNYIIKT